MKGQIAIVLFVLLAAIAVSGQTNRAVERIRQVYAETAEQARLAEQDQEQGETGALVLNELAVNSRGHQWRAVGIYQQRFRFFYRGGNSEKHLYPDELVMVKAERRISNRNYSEEYLYDRGGRLIFYYRKAENDDQEPAEKRVYFAAGKAVRVVEDGRIRDRLNANDLSKAKDILALALQIKIVFQRSIGI